MGKTILSLSLLLFVSITAQKYSSKLNIEWVEIPAGQFIFGKSNDTLELQHDYYISSTEITNQQYLEFLNSALCDGKIKLRGNRVIGYYPGDEICKKGYYTLIYYKDNTNANDIFRFTGYGFVLVNDLKDGQHPVTNVTWFGAYSFADYYGYRLPTNYEWEKAARGLNKFKYPWGDTLDGEFCNFFNSHDSFDNGTTPVKLYMRYSELGPEYAKGIGGAYEVYDMIGNVSEWTATYSSEYPNLRIYRGGSWRNKKEDFINYISSEGGPSLATNFLGFRITK